MADIKLKYPASTSDTVDITITLTSLASDTNLLAGRESDAVNNTSNLDLDHLVSGKITTGTSPTASRTIEVWCYAAWDVSVGTPTYPDVLDGTDSNETITSANVKSSMVRLLWSTQTDSTSDRTYFCPPTSVAQLFGALPPYWGLFIVHNTAVNLNATGSNHSWQYHRIQAQTV